MVHLENGNLAFAGTAYVFGRLGYTDEIKAQATRQRAGW